MPTATTARRARRVAIPPCREPFIGAPLLPVGRKPGEPERFRISTLNNVDGSTGVLLDETGTLKSVPGNAFEAVNTGPPVTP